MIKWEPTTKTGKWLKKLGWIGFLFFLLKGIGWLIVFYLTYKGRHLAWEEDLEEIYFNPESRVISFSVVNGDGDELKRRPARGGEQHRDRDELNRTAIEQSGEQTVER